MELNPNQKLDAKTFADQLVNQGLTAMDASLEASAAETTNNFNTEAEDPEKAEKAAKRKEKAQLSSTIADAIRARAMSSDSVEGKVYDALSRNSAICGYVSKNGPKIDFFIKSKKSKAPNGQELVSYVIALRQSAPSAPIAAIVRFPAALRDLLREGPNVTLNAYSAASADVENTILEIIPRDQWANMLNTKCRGFMPEDPSIFEPYHTKKAHIMTPSDVKGKAGVSSKPGMYLELSRKVMSIKADERSKAIENPEKMFNVKHTYRTRFQTPRNTIALKRYKTVKMKSSYSQEEATHMIHMYLSRFAEAKDANQVSKIANLDASCAELFNVKPATAGANDEIVGTAYFPVNEADSFRHRPECKVYHWYKRNPDGTPVELAFDEIALVKKVEKVSTKGTVSIRVDYDELKDTSAAEGTYRLDPQGEHAAIFKATNNALSYDDISRLATATTKSKSGAPRMVPTVAGENLAGCTAEQLRDIIASITSGTL